VKNLNEMAPAPTKPRLYRSGSMYYVVPITFEVELIDASGTAPVAPAANANGTGASS
jgi:hypothetical protein